MDTDLFLSVFSGRTDIVAKHHDFTDKKTGERIKGYSPICLKSGKAICLKKQGKTPSCYDCGEPEYASLTPALLTQHFKGKIILGMYPILNDMKSCRFIAADFDDHSSEPAQHKPKNDVAKLLHAFAAADVPAYTLKSKSGKGYHVYLFFSEPVENRKARMLFFDFLKKTGIISDDFKEDDKFHQSSFDRLFPNQNVANTGKKLGNLLTLPFLGIGNGKRNGFTEFLTDDLETPHPDQWQFLTGIRKMSPAEIDTLIADRNITVPIATGSGSEKPVSHKQPLDIIRIIDGLKEGERDDTLFRYACRLRSKGLAKEEIEIIVGNIASRCTPVFPHELAMTKVASAMRYDDSEKQPTRPTDAAWVQDALKPQKTDANRIARQLASYWLKQADGDSEQVRLSLIGWNMSNTPPLSEDEIRHILTDTTNRHGFDNFYRATGLTISHMERCQYPDGMIQYNIFMPELAAPAIFDSAGLLSKTVFQKTIFELRNIAPLVPTGKGSSEQWITLINDIAACAAIIEMPEELTVVERLRTIITTQIDNFDAEDDLDLSEELKTRVIVYNDQVMFKGNTIMYLCRFADASEELKRMNRKEINKLLTGMGFSLPTTATRVDGKVEKVFKISLESLRETIT